ncbi:MAG: hypothetical protein Kow00109_27540 [Acidobacteriota bacterium]
MLRKAMLLLSTMAFFTVPAAAQVHGDVFVGYSFLFVDDPIKDWHLHGWSAEAAFPVTDHLDLVVNGGGHYGSNNYVGFDAELDMHELLFGVRYGGRRSAKARGFVHALGGIMRGGAGASVLGVNIGLSDTAFGLAVGGGVELSLTEGLALRIAQVDYLSGWFEGDRTDNVRLSSGLTFRF